MSEKVLIAIIGSCTAVFVTLIGGLAAIAIMRDGTNEAVIVQAMIGFPSLLAAGAGPIITHYLHIKKGPTP